MFEEFFVYFSSKLVSPAQRQRLYDIIVGVVKEYKIIVITSQEIDSILSNPLMNLNWLEAVKSVEIIQALKPKRAVLDCPSHNTKLYKHYLLERLPIPYELIVEYKADVNYVESSAASILAKTVREHEVALLKKTL